jgi:hypothetical protein
MPDLTERLREKLIERIRRIVEDHCLTDHIDDAGVVCRCGAAGLTDHPRHVAEQIVDELALKPEGIDKVKKQMRYASAMVDWELSQLEGIER